MRTAAVALVVVWLGALHHALDRTAPAPRPDDSLARGAGGDGEQQSQGLDLQLDARGAPPSDAPEGSTPLADGSPLDDAVDTSSGRVSAAGDDPIAIKVATSQPSRRPAGHGVAAIVRTANGGAAASLSERLLAAGRTGPDGRTTLSVLCPEVLEPGTEARLLVRVTEPGFRAKDVEVMVHGIGFKPRGRAIVRPTRGFVRRVQVVDQGGGPVDVTPWVQAPLAHQEARNSHMKPVTKPGNGAVDVFVFDDPDGEITAHDPRYGRGSLRLDDLWHEGPADAAAHLVLQPGIGVRGRLLNRFGEPLAGLELLLRGSSDERGTASPTRASGRGFRMTLVTDALGEFQSIGLPEGKLDVEVGGGTTIAVLEPALDPPLREIVWDRVWVELVYTPDPTAGTTLLGFRYDHGQAAGYPRAAPRRLEDVEPPGPVTRQRVLLAPGYEYVVTLVATNAAGEQRQALTPLHVPTEGVTPPLHVRSPSAADPPVTGRPRGGPR